MENKFIVDFQTGTGNIEAETIELAKEIAKKNISYTQLAVYLRELSTNERIAYLPWYSTAASEDDIAIESFGELGFYGEWVDLEKED